MGTVTSIKKESKSIGVRLPANLREFVEKEADERGVDLSVVVIDALAFYREFKPSPEHVELLVEDILKEKPELLSAPLESLLLRKSDILQKVVDQAAQMLLERRLSQPIKK